MAIVERGEAFYVEVHRGRGRYEHVGTFRWDEHGGKRAARRAAERAEADAHERRRNRRSIETCDEFAARWPDDYPIVKHGPTRGQRKSDKTPHSLRHSTAHFSYVVRGDGPELAAYQLNHTDPNLVIRRYGKPFQGALDRLTHASDRPRVVPLRPADQAQEGGRGAWPAFRRSIYEHMFVGVGRRRRDDSEEGR